MSETKQYLNPGGVERLLKSIERKMAVDATKLWKTDPTWTASSKAALDLYVNSSTNKAYDTVNNRDIANYDVYAIASPGIGKDQTPQWYFDSGAWYPFVVDLQDYLKAQEIRDAFAAVADFNFGNLCLRLSGEDFVVPARLSALTGLLEVISSLPLLAMVTEVYSTNTVTRTSSVRVSFAYGTQVAYATVTAPAGVAVGTQGLLIRRIQYTGAENNGKDAGYSIINGNFQPFATEQADWNETDELSPSFIRNKPNIPPGVTVVNNLESTDGAAALAADQGPEIARLITEAAGEPITAQELDDMLYLSGFPRIGQG